MEERLKFVARLLDGEKMAVLCREFDISRKTGYKILTRYNDSGLEGLTDRSRRPYRHANQLPFQIEKLIVRLKQDKPTWGAPKIRERLARLYPDVHRPAISTVHMPCSTATAWSSAASAGATGRRGHHFQTAVALTIFGVPTTRASSAENTAGTGDHKHLTVPDPGSGASIDRWLCSWAPKIGPSWSSAENMARTGDNKHLTVPDSGSGASIDRRLCSRAPKIRTTPMVKVHF